MTKTIERKSNIDLLKIVSMLFIVIWHCIIHGGVLGNVINPTLNFIIQIILFTVIVHVNCFVMATGYLKYKTNSKYKKILSLFLDVVFYSLLFYLVFSLINNNTTFLGILSNIFPTVVSRYWFVLCYLILYILSDYLNVVINTLDKKKYEKFLLIITTLFSIIPFLFGKKIIGDYSYSFIHFILLYFIGAYLSKYPLRETEFFKKISDKKYRMILLGVFVGMVALNVGLNEFSLSINGKSQLLNLLSSYIEATRYSYSRPFVILQSIAFFELFNSLRIHWKWVSKTGPLLIGIYLITENEYVKPVIYNLLGISRFPISNYSFLFILILASIIIFISCLLLEYIRKKMMYLIKKISSKACELKTR